MVRHYLPKTTLLNTYNARIQPHIDYCINVWGHTSKTHLTPLHRQQRKAIRLINFKRKRDDTTELFKNDKILPLDQNLQLHSAKLLWKASHDLIPSPLKPLYNKRTQNSSFHLPFKRTELAKKCSSFNGVQTWNKIPEEIRLSNSLNILKSSYKNHLLSQL